MTNLLLTLLAQGGVPMDSLGDSTGALIDMYACAVLRYLAVRCRMRPARDGAGSNSLTPSRPATAPARSRFSDRQADVNAAERRRHHRALHWAVRAGRPASMADRLIRAGADVKAANRYGVTPLYLACLNGNAADDRKAAEGRAPMRTPSATEGETALMTVARTGNVEAAKVLLAHGADVDARENWQRQTALMWAAAENASGHGAGADRARRGRERARRGARSGNGR